MSKTALPQNWMEIKIGDVAVVNERNPEVRDLPDTTDVTFLPMAAVDAFSGSIADPETRPLGSVRKGFTSFADGDVLFAKITPSMENGKAAIARSLQNGVGFGSTEFHVLSPKSGLLSEYLFYFVRQERFRQEAKRHFTGTAGQMRVPTSFLEDHPLPLPPVPEQKRITTKVDELFSELDSGIRELEAAQAELKRYRASVLAAACSGKLVPIEAKLAKAEGRSYENATDLLERILKERREKWNGRGNYKEPISLDTTALSALPEGWAWTSVEQLSNKVQYGHTASAIQRRTGPRFLRITDIQNGSVDWNSVPSCNIPTSEIDDYRLINGDIVFARTGATVGKSFLLRPPFPEAIFASYLIRISPISSVLSDWLSVFFQSPDYWTKIYSSSAGIGQPNVNGTKLQALHVPLPPLSEQERIVAEVDRRFSVADEIEQVLSANLQRAERLRQSILQQAFSGKLVPQDVSDGSAIALLERISAKRDDIQSKKKVTSKMRGRSKAKTK